MNQEFVDHLATQFHLQPDEVAEGIRFVLGRGESGPLGFRTQEGERVLSYFHSVYGAHHGTAEDMDQQETFARLTVQDWRQFKSVDLDLTSRLTILTGENGTGKTSLLNLLGIAFGESIQFLGTPIRDKSGFRFRPGRRRPTGEFEQIGAVTFRSSSSSKVGVREWEGMAQAFFSPEVAPYRNIPGLYLDAQRVIGPYQQLESIPPRFNSAREIAAAYKEQLRNIWIPHQLAKSPSMLIKEALVAAALYGEGNSMVVGDPRAASVWSGFQDVLRALFPASLEFEHLQVDQGEIILRTRSGPFALEAASGGLAAIVSLAWQIYLHSVDAPEAFTVCFDEPENHLHPSLQRTLLPSLLAAFPTVHFIVATHSPFVVTSTREARVFALKRDEEGMVFSEEVGLDQQALTAEEVLDEVLGVGVTLPVWAEFELKRILGDFNNSPQRDSIDALVRRLEDAGLRLTMPDVTSAVASAVETPRGDNSL